MSVFEKLEEELNKMIDEHDKLAEGVPCSGANELLWKINGFAKAMGIIRNHELDETIAEAEAAIEKANNTLIR